MYTLQKSALPFALGLAAAMLAACGDQAPSDKTPSSIRIDGSSTVFPIIEAMAEEFQIAESGAVRVTVGISGTGGGFKKFCRGELDITDASRPIREVELEACRAAGIEFIELPLAFDALTVVINPANDWARRLTIDDLKTMWAPEAQGAVLNWQQANPAFPDAPLTLYGPGPDSGTFDYFTAAVVGREHASRGDYTASEDDNVLVQGVSSDRNALGYFGLAYYLENRDKLHAVAIVNPAGAAVAPSLETVRDGSYAPLSRPLFIYINAATAGEPAVRRFVEFLFTAERAAELVSQTGYVPLPAEAYATALANFRAGKLGTVFAGGSEVGIDIAELLNREARH